jgi:hypothetical protein
VTDLHCAATQHMQVGMPFACVEPVQSAQRSGVVQLGPDPEALKDAGETVDGRMRGHMYELE